MSETIKVRWLVDHEQNKVAPKTLSSQVINEDGTLFKDEVNNSIVELSDRVDHVSETLGTKANKTDIVQADWNQHDPAALDYVKNRTHWVEDDGETYHPLDEKFIPDTIATKDYVESLAKKLSSTTILGFYCIEDVTVVTNGIAKVYPANSNVEMTFADEDVFEIIPTSNNSILSLSAFPGALGTYYSWLEGVKQFSNILFDMNNEEMYTKWSQGNQGAYQVQFAQYTNCIFWSDNPYISDVSKRTNYTLCATSQLPLCYSTIPDNTFKSFYLAFGVNSDPNWSNPAYKESFAKATWATQAFSYYGARIVGYPGHDSANFTITLPKDCRGLMFDARNIECAGTFDAVNCTNFGAKSGSWREAFGDCPSLRRLYIKNLKVNLNISWSPVDYDSISYIISSAANTSAITISVSPYTYNLLSASDFELATSKNITIALITTNYVEDKRLSAVTNKADANHTHDDIYYTQTDIDTKLTSKSDSTHHHDDKYDAKGAASDALDSAKSYADTAVTNVKNDLLNGAGDAYDTLKELGDLIDDNTDAIEALETIATSKASIEYVQVGYETKDDAQAKYDAIVEAKADWNMNDEADLAYIKNRTHWVDTTHVVLFDNETLSFTAQSETLYAYSSGGSYNLSVGDVFEVVWDGTIYNCTCFEYQGVPAIGSKNVVGVEDDTTEPFLMYTHNGTILIVTNLTNATHTVSLSGDTTTYHTLDKKYLPHLVGKEGTGVCAEVFNEYNGYNVAEGEYAHAEGYSTQALGNRSHAEGWSTHASGHNSHTEGFLTTASGPSSHAEGSHTEASGSQAHTEGDRTVASGASSHAEGLRTTAASNYQHVQGKLNITDTEGKYLHIVGNGTFDATTEHPSNAHTLDWSGNAWFAGNIKIGGTGYDDEVAKMVLTSDAELITIADIDEICGSSIVAASEVTF